MEKILNTITTTYNKTVQCIEVAGKSDAVCLVAAVFIIVMSLAVYAHFYEKKHGEGSFLSDGGTGGSW